MVAKYVRLRSRKKAEIRREVDICRKVTGRSPYLMEFHDVFERGKNLVIVTELVPGGQLIERILEDNDLTEGVVVRYLSHLLAALDTLHTMNIAHLHIKPENLLISGVEENPIIKLIDFGSAQELNGDVAMIASSSPEVIGQEGPQLVSDMWSVGVLTYVLLGGTSPFFSENAVMVVDRIKEARYDFYGEQFEQISTEAKEFISALLQKSPEYRMSASQALQHDWITVSYYYFPQ
ncbi:Death-associated protein kinase 3, partial [Geodia barretti]